MKTALTNLFMRADRKQTAIEVEEELQFHLDMLEREYTQYGMSSAAATTAALKRFGNLEKVKKQCVHISRRSSRPRRALKASLILLALTGLSIHILSSDIKVAHIGDTLIMIAISGRLLLYVRGLVPPTFFPKLKKHSLSVTTDTPEDGARAL